MDMMKYCPECYKELPPNSITCPYCGYKTGNGVEETPDGILRTPQVDSYIPPEQTVLGLLLLTIFFWGFNIAGTALPFFLDAGTKRNLLIALIVSQVLSRALIGVWAVEEVSLKKDASTKNKLGTFLLALIPIGDIIPALHAARTAIRKERLPILSIASISAVVIMSLVLFRTSDQIANLINGIDIVAQAESTALVTESAAAETETPTPEPTATLRPYINGCRNPLTVTADEEGETLEICGEITNFGVKDCPSCPFGFYSFVKLEDKFQIVSYEWRFTHAWLNKCVMIEDKVELLGDTPTFVFNTGEGCIGDCVHDFHGGLIDDNGIYFQPFDGCN
ncbi:MAG: hypothetical protein DRI65_03605 [Chloroflexota bacterium]|nr:MAG: hypothetical protein DRI65_03605 [Chloroflexota bacterium]